MRKNLAHVLFRRLLSDGFKILTVLILEYKKACSKKVKINIYTYAYHWSSHNDSSCHTFFSFA